MSDSAGEVPSNPSSASSASAPLRQEPSFFKKVKAFYIQHDSEDVFKRLNDLCEECWHDPRGDAWFEERRKRADTADEKDRKNFYGMMLQIGAELETEKKIFSQFRRERCTMGQNVRILDLCMAPGGYTGAALKKLPFARACGLTLPVEMGGHPVLLYKAAANVEYADLTMLLHEIMAPWDADTDITKDQDDGVASGSGGPITSPAPAPAPELDQNPQQRQRLTVPPNHPDAANFSTARPFRNMLFNLIFCDGQVLRTHPRQSYREKVEARRLLVSQAIIALQRLPAEGGTVVFLLHRLENPYTVQFLYLFSRFAEIDLFKPAKKHAIRSSFYLVARNIRARSPEALEALNLWKRVWWNVTFEGGEMNVLEMGEGDKAAISEATNEPGNADGREKFESVIQKQTEELQHILEVFGEKLVELARPLWKIQIAALEKKMTDGFRAPVSAAHKN
ncbi:hypothetical protein KEM56_007871 [Ascosphaera pollenicola]|nr:hypothetical protein KEM56_007871 [Ascosphaera pollenicola]